MRRGVVVALVLGVLWPAQAVAAPATVAIDSRAPKLAEADGGGYTASLGFTNLTDADAPLAVTATGDPGCEPTLDKPKVPAAEKVTAKLTIPAECTLPGDRFKAVVTAGAARFDVQSARSKEAADDPEWDDLVVFPLLLGLFLLAALLLFAYWAMTDDESHSLREPLDQLDATWSFADSWVSNVTVVAALLTGIIGSSDVLTAVVGEEAGGALALATVGAAIAAALIAAGPIALVICKRGKAYTVGGMLLAASIVLAGAAGQLWITYRAGASLDLGGAEDYLVYGTALAFGMLFLYGVRSVHELLEAGTTEPKKARKKASDTIVAAWMIVKELRRARDDEQEEERVREIDRILEDLERHPTSPGDELPVQRRAAMI
ncbi:MAG TPA: hypothetical protein VHF89_03735 [Solirubrobacteraceae bacterium]|nr:hypothetical protein [Solirubrobacteraceae bacterium]